MPRRIVVIGGVAAGPKAAARARRIDPQAQITVLERGQKASYGACGFPYHLAGEFEDLGELAKTPAGAIRNAAFFHKVKNVALHTNAEVTQILRPSKEVVYRDGDSGQAVTLPYDRLILATGAKAVTPPIPGVDLKNVYVLKEYADAETLAIAAEALEKSCGAPNAVIVGAGLIGMEVAESLLGRGWRVTVVEAAAQVMPALDPEIAAHLEKYAAQKGLRIFKAARVAEILGAEGKARGVRLSDQDLPADLVLVATGIRPEVDLARSAGLAIGPTGAIQVDEFLRTSDPDIFAAGDCAERDT